MYDLTDNTAVQIVRCTDEETKKMRLEFKQSSVLLFPTYLFETSFDFCLPYESNGKQIEILRFVNSDSTLNDCNIWEKIGIGENFPNNCSKDEILFIAIKNNFTNVVNTIINNNNATLCLRAACLAGNIEVVKTLIEKGANDKRKNGCTSKHFAAMGGNLEVFKYLMNIFNANDNVPDVNGYMPLHYAVMSGSLEIVEFLASHEEVDNWNITDKQGRNLLFCARDNVELVKYLINTKKLDHQVIDEYGFTLVHRAAAGGYLDVLKYYIEEKGLHFDVQNNFDMTPLFMATRISCKLDVVEYLVNMGANVNASVKDCDRKPIWGAARNGKLEVIKYLIGKGAKLENSSVIQAAFNGHTELMNYFLNELGAKPSVQCAGGLTPLHYAVMGGKLDVVKLLANHPSVDCNIISDNDTNILFFTQGHLDIVKYLIETKNVDYTRIVGSWTLLFVVAHRGLDMLDIVKYLLEEKKVNPAEPNNDGWTALYLAAIGGSLDVVEYLVNRGEDINASTIKNRRPVSGATYGGDLDIVKYLISKGASIDFTDIFGLSPVLNAAEQGHFDIVKFYIEEMKVSIIVKDINDRCILHHAVHGENLEMIQYLVESHNGDKMLNHRRSDSGCIALHEAISKRYTDIAKYLISKGSSVHSSDKFRNTSLHKASRTGNLDLVDMLLKKKAYINCVTNTGDTPLHLAVKGGHLDVANYLISNGADANLCNNRRATPLYLAREHKEMYDII